MAQAGARRTRWAPPGRRKTRTMTTTPTSRPAGDGRVPAAFTEPTATGQPDGSAVTMTPLALAQTALSAEQHRRVAIALFNRAWDLLEVTERTPDLDDEMLHTAHASRFHWTAAGGDVDRLATGEWQCARVYAVLGRAEPAAWHAQRALALCRAAGITGFLAGAACEALARAALVGGDPDAARRWAAQARGIAAQLDDVEDSEVLLADLDELDHRLAATDGIR